MVIKLYGYPVSACAARAAIVFREYNVPFELVYVDLLNGGNKTPAFIEAQPFGQVPYVDDNGFRLYESRAIARYIATKYNANVKASLLPDIFTKLEKSAKFEQAASVEVVQFDQYAVGAVIELIVKA